VEQDRLLRSSAGVEGAWADGTDVGHVRRPVCDMGRRLFGLRKS
jgi:hypothetical protein